MTLFVAASLHQPTFRRGDTSATAFAAYVCTAKMLGRVSEERRPRPRQVEISAIGDPKIRAIGGRGGDRDSCTFMLSSDRPTKRGHARKLRLRFRRMLSVKVPLHESVS